jgi:hypothetical protein
MADRTEQATAHLLQNQADALKRLIDEAEHIRRQIDAHLRKLRGESDAPETRNGEQARGPKTQRAR